MLKHIFKWFRLEAGQLKNRKQAHQANAKFYGQSDPVGASL